VQESTGNSNGLPHLHPGVKTIIRKALNYLYPKSWRELFFLASPEQDVENSSLYVLTESLDSYHTLLILKVLFAGPTFWSLGDDDNYFQGDYVKTWVDDLILYLQLSGIKYDRNTSEFFTNEETLKLELKPIDQAEFIPVKFLDEFYEKLRGEINKCYTYGLANASTLFSIMNFENSSISNLISTEEIRKISDQFK
jgi:hypothetical protein